MKINIEHEVGDDLLTDKQERIFCRWAEGVYRERVKQVQKWGDQHHPDGTGWGAAGSFYGMADHYREVTKVKARMEELGSPPGVRVAWSDILLEEVYEAMEEDERGPLTGEMRQVAAVLAAWWADIQSRRE